MQKRFEKFLTLTTLSLVISSLTAPMALASKTSPIKIKKNIVMMIPGAGASGPLIEGFPESLGNQYLGVYEKALTDLGIDASVCPKDLDHDSRTLEERGEMCVKQILDKEHGVACSMRNIVIVGHSMGGLIARLLAQDPRVSSCIQSVLTLATPHMGTPLADFAIDHENTKVDVIGEILRLVGFGPRNNHYLPELRADHTHDASAIFNAQTIADNPNIRYFSISDSFTHDLSPLEVTNKILASLLRDEKLDQTPFGDRNDGIVPEYSAIHGTYLGHLEINHWQAACVDPVRFTEGCRTAKAFIIPIIQRLVTAPDLMN